jgi:Tfp pilus assembly protein PilE
MMMEKYLNDSLSTRSKADSARIEAANLMPAYFKRLQYREDSIRAFKWFQTTRDSTYIERYTKVKTAATSYSQAVALTRKGSVGTEQSLPSAPTKPAFADRRPVLAAIIPERSLFFKKESIQ